MANKYFQNKKMISYTTIASLASKYLNDTSVEYIPEVSYNEPDGRLCISGESYHEYAVEFFQPVFDWLQRFIEEKPERKLTVSFKMSYYNTSTSRRFVDMMRILEEHHQRGGNVTVEWHYEADDFDMSESGKEFAQSVSFEFKFFAY